MSAQDLSGDLVGFILKHDTTKRILREHTADASGHCPKCPGGGDSSGRAKAPCTLYTAALAAQKLGGSKP